MAGGGVDRSPPTPGAAARSAGPLVLITTMLEPSTTVGVSTHVVQVGEQMAEAGHRVCVITPRSFLPPVSRVLLVPVRLLRRVGSEHAVRLDRYLHLRFMELALRREFRREVPALVYAQEPRSARAALKARAADQVPIVMVVHYNESQAEELVERRMIARGGRADRAIRAFEAEVLPRLDGLVFVSDFMLGHLRAKLPVLEGIPSSIVPNFVAAVDAAAAPDAAAAAPLGDCISVGSLVERKNHAYLLHVLAAARRRGFRYTLTLVGGGPRRAALGALARQLGVADQVLFAGPRRDVDQLLARHRVYVHSSVMENCPFALIEAFRSGLPVVSGAVGGIPEILGTEGAGRVWDLDDAEAGAHVLSALLEDDAGLAAAADAATARFRERFDARVAGKDLMRFLDSMGAGQR